jgi:hypothetical protein
VNIFYLNKDPKICAQEHCDKHVVKMIIEYAQLLSTAHRVCDGDMYYGKTANGRNIKRWRLPDGREQVLYKASHINHPSAIWARKTNNNYNWLYCLFVELCEEYTYRYGKVHETDRKLRNALSVPPRNIEVGYLTQMPQAMPEHCKMPNPIDAYKNYYIKEKVDFAKWTKRNDPRWYNANIQF